jgi:hypothetical protein
MKRFILLCLIIFASVFAKAQNHGNIKAIVLDSINKQPISFATVAVLKLKDSSLVSYTITDKAGAFTLRGIGIGESSRLLISHVGYQSVHLNLNFRKAEQMTDLGQIFLSPKTLQEVTIKGERVPVVIKKDTIEFNAEAFKVRPNAVVEDLLKKLPGVQVDHTGSITVNGKNVTKIKVDGKDFFANDPKIATRNLDAEMISKVQVYDDRENDPDHLQPDYAVGKIINLKFKKALQRSSFGRAVVAGGTEDHYQANGFANRFEGNLQLSARLSSDNLSNTGMFGDGSSAVLQSQPSGSIQKNTNGDFNFNDQFGKNVKLNITYNYSNDVTTGKSTVNRQQFIGDTTFNSLSVNSSNRRSGNHNAGAVLEYGSDTATHIRYQPAFSYSSNSNNSSGGATGSNNFASLLSRSITSDNSSGSNTSFQQTFTYYTKLDKKKGTSLSINSNLNISPSHSYNFSYNDLQSYVAALQSDTLNKYSKNTNISDAGNLNVGFHYPITKKLSATISVGSNYDRNEGDLLTYQQDLSTGQFNIFLQDQSNNLTRKEWDESAHPELQYKFNDAYSIKIGVIAQLEEIGNHFNTYTNDLNQHFGYFFPSVQFDLNKVHFSYNENVRQPSINDLQPLTIVYSPLFTFIGDPNLKATHLHTFALNYFDFKPDGNFSVFLNSSFAIETNSIVRERSISAEGAEVTTPINRNGRLTASLNAFIRKSFKKTGDWQFAESTNLTGSSGHNFFDVNNHDGYQNTVAIFLREEFTANWKDIIELRPNYSISPAVTTYQFVDFKSSSYITHTANLALDLHAPKKMTWNLNYAYIYNPLVAQGFQKSTNLLSMSLARTIQKNDMGEIRLTCYDLLNQAISTFHYATENTINDIQNQSVRRYFLLSYSYRFRKNITR